MKNKTRDAGLYALQWGLCGKYILISIQSMYIFHVELYCSVLLPRRALELFSF